jgi:hypothetical protein
MKHSQLKQLIKEEIKKILTEEIDIASELDVFFQNNPYTEKNQWSHEYEAKDHIQNIMGRPLTPQEKSKVTRITKKYRDDFWGKNYREKRDKEDAEQRERYQNNLLPLTTDNGNGTPDITYYTLANTYRFTDPDGNVHISHSDPKSGYTDYKLRDKWINTPVDKATLNRYWPENRLRYIGWYSQGEK